MDGRLVNNLVLFVCQLSFQELFFCVYFRFMQNQQTRETISARETSHEHNNKDLSVTYNRPHMACE